MFDDWDWGDLWLNIFDVVFSFLLFPIQLIMYPIDMILDRIPGIEVIPESIAAVVSFVGDIPETMVSLMGLSPIIWNALFVVFILHLTLSPAINAIKRVWAFMRP